MDKKTKYDIDTILAQSKTPMQAPSGLAHRIIKRSKAMEQNSSSLHSTKQNGAQVHSGLQGFFYFFNIPAIRSTAYIALLLLLFAGIMGVYMFSGNQNAPVNTPLDDASYYVDYLALAYAVETVL